MCGLRELVTEGIAKPREGRCRACGDAILLERSRQSLTATAMSTMDRAAQAWQLGKLDLAVKLVSEARGMLMLRLSPAGLRRLTI